MQRDNLGDLAAFVSVAEERSFTRAAAKLGMTQSSLSHTVRRLETRLGLRLLARTTRCVAPTDAGERLLRTLRPALDDIDAELAALSELREKPAGSIRITTAGHAAETILLPALERLLPEYPDIKVEITIDYGLTDVVAERYDAGVRNDCRTIESSSTAGATGSSSPAPSGTGGAPAVTSSCARRIMCSYRSSPNVFVYLRNGQDDAQQSRDKYECDKWAVEQSGLDPTQNIGGVRHDPSTDQRMAYQRAMGVCLCGMRL